MGYQVIKKLTTTLRNALEILKIHLQNKYLIPLY